MESKEKNKKDIEKTKPLWLKYTEQEVKDIVLNIAKKEKDLTAEKIGLILRDSYGIPSTRVYGIKISDILKEAGIYTEPDLKNLSNKVNKLEKHTEKNKKDKRTGRALIIAKARLKKEKEYLESV